MAEMTEDMGELQKNIHGTERGYFTSDEHDLIEQLLFRYLMCRETIWGLIDYHRNYQEHFNSEELQTKSFVIGFTAASNLYYYSSLFIYAFLDSPFIIAKLNEADKRYDIPEYTYDKVFHSLTDPDNIKAIRAARQLFDEALHNPDSPLIKLIKSDEEYRTIIDNVTSLCDASQSRVDEILEKRSLLLPAVRNALRHTEINKFAQEYLHKADDILYAIRGLTFLKVSRLRKPGVDPIKFTKDQIRQMKSKLLPGDIILTFSEGYMSNLFLPGTFKHGITYVGTVEQRKNIGLAQITKDQPASHHKQILEAIETEKLPDGSEADMVEALAEGVIFNSLEHLLTQRISRIVVWRPLFTKEQHGANLGNLFAFLGSDYDFKFDFNDAIYQCCTEVIYRSLNKIGPIELKLTKRMGRQTLSADDLCLYALESGEQLFECVALALPDKSSKENRPELFFGQDGLKKLKEIMST